jgi:hypothetical protein
MLAGKREIQTPDIRPINGWKRDVIRFCDAGAMSLPKEGLFGFTCGYYGSIPHSRNTLWLDEGCAVVRAPQGEHGYRITGFYRLAVITLDGRRIEMDYESFDASYHTRTNRFDALKEAEEFVSTDLRKRDPDGGPPIINDSVGNRYIQALLRGQCWYLPS